MKALSDQLVYIENNICNHNLLNPKISSKNIGWQINHSLRVINSICKALEQSNPSEFKKKKSFTKSFILITGWIPRGKGRAPKSVKIEDEVKIEDLKRRLKYAVENIEKMNSLNKNSFFTHPLLGDLKLKETKRFIRIHTNHHLKIIKDIIK